MVSLVKSNAHLCQEVLRLREEHRSVLEALQRLQEEQLMGAGRMENTPPISDPPPSLSVMEASSDCSDELWEGEGMDLEDMEHSAESLPACSVDEEEEDDGGCDHAGGDPFASVGLSTIGKMWDGFSVKDYTLYEPSQGNDEKECKEWSPGITVPQPFNMTLREVLSPKKKTRSMALLEAERMEEEAHLQAELKKSFRSTPVPPSTYLPLYNVLVARSKERREMVRMQRKALLKEQERPFSFTKQEEDRKSLKSQQKGVTSPESSGRQTWMAKPFPAHLFDPWVTEQIHEEEEYRKLRIKMRAEEMLASSKAPVNMKGKYEAAVKRLMEGPAYASPDQAFTFHPRVNRVVPDHDQEYLNFQKKLARSKRVKKATASEPFHFHTQLISTTKKIDDKYKFSTPESYKNPRKGKPKCPLHLDDYQAPMTKTAVIRQNLVQEKLKVMAEKELTEKLSRETAKERAKELQKRVSQMSMCYDKSALLEEKKKMKLEEHRFVCDAL